MQIIQNRRTFLAGLSAAGAAASSAPRHRGRAEPPPETTTVRLGRWSRWSTICWGPSILAGELLRADGMTRCPLRAGRH